MSTPVILDYPPVTPRQRAALYFKSFPQTLFHYLISFFPIFQWITRYNLSWLFQDMIAGMTVGMVHVPQGIAYAKVANLPPQYGLYTAFVGSCLYCFFGTSKDISIGPITVVSLLVGRAISNVTSAHPDITGPEVAVYLSVITGFICIAIGMIRLGILVDFIPGPAIAGYMTGSAITISLGQWGKLTGLKLNTHQAPYLVLGQFFANLGHVHVDIAFGVVSLVALYVVKFACARLGQRSPQLKRGLFYVGIMRSGVVLMIGTLISFLINMHRTSSPFSIIKTVPAGFDAVGVPRLNLNILGEVGDVLPSILIIMILEHVSVAKAFGRVSDYTINADQEIVAIGVCNVVGGFFGAYPGTGAFSRTAIMARSGAKSPMASMFGAAVIVLALYALTPAFYYIPDAILAAVVIHAVSDLVSGPAYIKELWHASVLEFAVFLSAVLITFFDGVESGIYAAVAVSMLLLLLRLARPSLTPLARAPLAAPSMDTDFYGSAQHYIYVDEKDAHFAQRFEPMPPGVLTLRLSHALLYPNAAYIAETILSFVKARTRRGEFDDQHQALWTESPNDHLRNAHLPLLEALVLDFTSVSRIDATALQMLKSVREGLDRYAGHPVEWHFTGLHYHQQVRQDLIQFGFGTLDMDEMPHLTDSCVSDATVIHDEVLQPPPPTQKTMTHPTLGFDAEHPFSYAATQQPRPESDMIHPYYLEYNKRLPALPRLSHMPLNDPHDGVPRDCFPCFHWDVDTAVRSICERWNSRRCVTPHAF